MQPPHPPRWRPWTTLAALGLQAPLIQAQTPPAPSPGSTGTALPGTGGDLFSEAFFLKLGFSFMIGLALGFALKIAFKIALAVIGLILLADLLRSDVGIVEVNWSGLEVHYDGWSTWLSAHAGAFFDFIADNLSSAASFLAGLALGLKL